MRRLHNYGAGISLFLAASFFSTWLARTEAGLVTPSALCWLFCLVAFLVIEGAYTMHLRRSAILKVVAYLVLARQYAAHVRELVADDRAYTSPEPLRTELRRIDTPAPTISFDNPDLDEWAGWHCPHLTAIRNAMRFLERQVAAFAGSGMPKGYWLLIVERSFKETQSVYLRERTRFGIKSGHLWGAETFATAGVSMSLDAGNDFVERKPGLATNLGKFVGSVTRPTE